MYADLKGLEQDREEWRVAGDQSMDQNMRREQLF